MLILAADSITAAGVGPQNLWTALVEGHDTSQRIGPNFYSRPVPPGGRVCLIENGRPDFKSAFEKYFCQIWERLQDGLQPQTRNQIESGRIGVIFSSTKGLLEDFIWDEQQSIQRDPLTPLLEDFIGITNLKVEVSICVSNACASTHMAFELAQCWLQSQRLDFVVVVAADLIGPFVYSGFQSLKAMSSTINKPFSADRDGLQLGEAVAIFILATENRNYSPLARLAEIQSETEGQSVTRPSDNGESLARVGRKVVERFAKKIDAVIAHGTGTTLNDRAEDQALSMIFGQQLSSTPITGTKWSLGHTLGASGAVDILAGLQALKNQRLFRIASVIEKDPDFHGLYLSSKFGTPPKNPNNLLITSLGFGGVHAALILEKLN